MGILQDIDIWMAAATAELKRRIAAFLAVVLASVAGPTSRLLPILRPPIWQPNKWTLIRNIVTVDLATICDLKIASTGALPTVGTRHAFSAFAEAVRIESPLWRSFTHLM
jgi:hypothetical protein